MNEQVLNKLKKLLSLTVSANPHEAELALEKATAIAAQAGIDLALIDVKQEQAPKIELVKESVSLGNRLPTVQKYINWILMNHFNVRLIISGSRNGGRSISILGDKVDVEFAKHVNGFLSEDMQRRWDYYKASNNLSIKHKQTFLYNLYRGLNDKLHKAKEQAVTERFNQIPAEQKESAQNKYSLVIKTKTDLVNDFVAKNYPRLSSARRSTIRTISDSTVCSDAYTIGSSINIHRPLC
jgi:hypothetical protein